MTQLVELDAAIRKLNDLIQVCLDDDIADQLAEQRDVLDDQAQQLALASLQEGTPQLKEALSALQDLVDATDAASADVSQLAKGFKTATDLISKTQSAVEKIAKVIS